MFNAKSWYCVGCSCKDLGEEIKCEEGEYIFKRSFTSNENFFISIDWLEVLVTRKQKIDFDYGFKLNNFS